MYRVVQGNMNSLSDAEAFVDLLQHLDQHPFREVRTLFDARQKLVVTRAPGRLDVMGGIADYSGSMVLELPIREATFVALQRDPELKLRVLSLSDPLHEAAFEMSLEEFVRDGKPIEYDSARTHFQVDPKQHWAAYVAGVFLVLMRERGVRFPQGARMLISSSVPAGKGVSSSAALEVGVMQAVAAAFDIEIQPRELAMLCQKVENLVVGAPCGIMDQVTSASGEAGRLLALLCQPAELLGMISIPEDLSFWGIDSGVSHSVAGSDYGSVRTGAFMGYRLIAEMAGLNIKQIASEDRCEIDDPRWKGYLANISPAEFEKHYRDRLPERLSGGEFLGQYGGTTDRVSRVDPSREYAIRIPTAHPIYEHQRVRRFTEVLEHDSALASESSGSTGDHLGTSLQVLGELMYESHDSYSACGLNSEGTDLLVKLVRQAGPLHGLYGAKITGGGSGGTVAVLASRSAAAGIEMICERYAKETGRQPYVFAGSSSGSVSFGHLDLEVAG